MDRSNTLKWLIVGAIAILAIVVFFVLGTEVSSAQFLPIPEIEDVPDPEGEGLQKGYNLIYEIFVNFRAVIGAVAILMIVISGIRMVVQASNEEAMTKQRKNLYWTLVGLVLVGVAMPVGEILDLQEGGFLSDEYEIAYRARLFDDRVHIVTTFIKYIVGSVAVLFMVRSGAKLIIAGESEEVLSTEKKNLLAGGFALFLIMLADTVVNQVLFKVDEETAEFGTQGQGAQVQFDVGRGVEEIVGITNFIVIWTAPVAVLALVIGGVMYVTAFGDEERTNKAKKVLINSVIALLIIYGSYAIVATLISGVF